MSKTPKKEIKIQSDIWLGRIVYNGDNIGHEFSFKFKLGDKIFKLSRTLEYSEINIIYTKLFTNFYTEEQNIELVIEAEENDDIPDTAKGSVFINVAKQTGIAGSIDLKINEQGVNGIQKKQAILTFIFLERTYSLGIKTLTDVDKHGWLVGYYVDPETLKEYGETVAFPFRLKVDLQKIETKYTPKIGFTGEEFFEILEGHLTKDKKKCWARLKLKRGGKSRFSEKTYDSSAKIKFTIEKRIANNNYFGKLKFYNSNNIVITVDAITKINNVTLPKGLYDLQIPDEPHKLGKLYEKYIPYSKTWFRIKNKANPEIGYYLHYGQASAGCVTVTEVKDSNGKFIDIWTPIYNYLILRRETNKIGIVGTIEIIYKNKVK